MCQLNDSTKKLIKYTLIVMTIVIIVKASYELKWLDVASGICKLESDRNKAIKRISLKTLAFIGLIDSEELFKEKLSGMGWHFVKNYGRGMIFEKEGYEILITKKNYFNRYLFFEVTTREIFDVI